jgi:hypothetical protein
MKATLITAGAHWRYKQVLQDASEVSLPKGIATPVARI